MADVFKQIAFKELNLNDPFFDSLKKDYAEFSEWFEKKQVQGAKAEVLKIDDKISAFIYLKDNESEKIELTDRTLPAAHRIKIGTLKIDDYVNGKRLGEGAIGIALWRWFKSASNEIYVTVFPKHKSLINLFEKFGFMNMGLKKGTNENVMIKNKRKINYDTPYKSFPYINPEFKKAGLLVINENYHDKLFTYSEINNVKYTNDVLTDVAGNGITKMYVSSAYSGGYEVNEPVLIYRKSTSSSGHGFKSVVTSLATIVKKTLVKNNGAQLISRDEVIEILGNKTVLTSKELDSFLANNQVAIYQLVYNYPFGAGRNINWNYLKNNGYWETYPTKINYSPNQLGTLVRDKENDIIDILKAK